MTENYKTVRSLSKSNSFTCHPGKAMLPGWSHLSGKTPGSAAGKTHTNIPAMPKQPRDVALPLPEHGDTKLLENRMESNTMEQHDVQDRHHPALEKSGQVGLGLERPEIGEGSLLMAGMVCKALPTQTLLDSTKQLEFCSLLSHFRHQGKPKPRGTQPKRKKIPVFSLSLASS